LRQGKPSIIQSQVRRAAAGIWKCRGCKTTFAGGAFEFATSVATTAKVTMNRLKKLKEELNSAKQEEEVKKETKQEKKEKKAEKKPKAPKA
jgi:large subunit ribosomal protein L37Ae